MLDWIVDKTLYQGEDAAVVSRIIHISSGFALGLDWAHQHGLVHRDVKPGNLLLTAEGTPKVADFGLATAVRASAGVADGLMTCAYASPEQLSGTRLTSSTDVWSWAVSILQMFMGGLFWSDGRVVPSVFSEFCSHHFRMPGLPQMPSQIADLLDQCFELDPKNRPVCRELAVALDGIHRELFGESIEFLECGTAELAADSVNNRAMSLIQTARIDEACALLDSLVRSRPDHFEGNINFGLIMVSKGLLDWRAFKTRMSAFDHEHGDRLRELIPKAESVLKQPAAASDEHPRLHDFPFVLARPKSGAQHHHDTARFNRLISKATTAMTNHDFQEAKRYLTMVMDLESFEKHPKVRDLAGKLGM
jgi:serine/threonine protein kinase